MNPRHVPRGEAVHRTCRNHGLIVLNGRALSDRHGGYTFCTRRSDREIRTVLDLAIVPREATADLRVVRVSQERQLCSHHRMLLVSVAGPEEPALGEPWSATESRWTPHTTREKGCERQTDGAMQDGPDLVAQHTAHHPARHEAQHATSSSLRSSQHQDKHHHHDQLTTDNIIQY